MLKLFCEKKEKKKKKEWKRNVGKMHFACGKKEKKERKQERKKNEEN
jgi:hypothetical protein